MQEQQAHSAIDESTFALNPNKRIRLIQQHTMRIMRIPTTRGMKALRAAMLITLCGFIASPKIAVAYNTCDDPGSPCTHEQMTTEGFKLYTSAISNSVNVAMLEEFITYEAKLLEGVAAPDLFDPVYGNRNLLPDSLITIINTFTDFSGDLAAVTYAHLWDADNGIGAPVQTDLARILTDENLKSRAGDMLGLPERIISIDTLLGILDGFSGVRYEYNDYPNAFQASQACWSRALGEYSRGNKDKAYYYLGMVAHFLGDQSIPTHAHGDSHGPDALDYDAYEEWMSLIDIHKLFVEYVAANDNFFAAVLRESGALDNKQLINDALQQIADLSDLDDYSTTLDVVALFYEWNDDRANPVDVISPEAFVTDEEMSRLISEGILQNTEIPIEDQLLWLFLNVNQRADYFASNGDGFGNLDGNGDTVHPNIDDYPWLDGFAQGAIDGAIEADDGTFPTVMPDLEDNLGESSGFVNDENGKLSVIRENSYLYGVRGISGLFALWEKAISMPILRVSIAQMEEQSGSGLDFGIGAWADLYAGITMGNNYRGGERSSYYSPGSILEDRTGQKRYVEDEEDFAPPLPSTMTRVAANALGDGPVKAINAHFGRAYSAKDGSTFLEGIDVVEIELSAWDKDPSTIGVQPYAQDDNADIYPGNSRAVPISVDLGKCLAGADDAITITDRYGKKQHDDIDALIKTIRDACNGEPICLQAAQPRIDDLETQKVFLFPNIDFKSGKVIAMKGNEDEVKITFSVSLVSPGPDSEPPVVTCAAADGIWHAADVSIACTAVDTDSGLADNNDAAFWLWTSVLAGTETTNAFTASYEVCDVAGNCASAGPIGGNKIDKKAPVISCGTVDDVWHATNVVVNCTAVDGGSGLANPADAAFMITTDVPEGTETDSAFTSSNIVCDAVGNCAPANSIGGIKVDRKAPVITISEPTAKEYTRVATMILNYTVTDGGSGVATTSPTLDGETTVGGNDLSNGQEIDLLIDLALGEHTFTVNADDNVGNVSPETSIIFSIVVTPQSIIDTVIELHKRGEIKKQMVNPLLAKLRNALKKDNQGKDNPAQGNMYGAFINHVQAQDGKKISPLAAEILIGDAEYLIAELEETNEIAPPSVVEVVGPTNTTPEVTIPVIVTNQSIMDKVTELNEAGSISTKTSKSLLGKLRNAKKKADKGNHKSTRTAYESFIKSVNSKMGKSVTQEDAASLIADAQYLISNLP